MKTRKMRRSKLLLNFLAVVFILVLIPVTIASSGEIHNLLLKAFPGVFGTQANIVVNLASSASLHKGERKRLILWIV